MIDTQTLFLASIIILAAYIMLAAYFIICRECTDSNVKTTAAILFILFILLSIVPIALLILK